MPNAGTNFPSGVDTFNSAYDPDLGPAVAQIESILGVGEQPTAIAAQGVKAQSFPDLFASSSLASTAGTVFAQLITLTAGTTISKISYDVTTALVSATNQWAGIASFATTSKVLAISADGLTAAQAIDTVVTYSLGTPYVVPASGLYYVFHMVAAGTGPVIAAAPTLGTHGRGNIAPITAGPCATTQTTVLTVGSTFTQPTASAATPLYYLT